MPLSLLKLWESGSLALSLTSPDADPGRWWHSWGCQPEPALLEPAQAAKARWRANAGLISEAPLIVDRQRQWQDWKKKWVVTGSPRTTKGDQRQNGFRPGTPGLNTGPSGGSEGGELHPAQGTALAPPVYTGLHLLPGHRPLATLNPPRHAFIGMLGTRLQATLPHSLRLQKHSRTRRCH